jgi:EAL domain-containing protein (putative c-di-GMP-specific phosphodiesterase class I)
LPRFGVALRQLPGPRWATILALPVLDVGVLYFLLQAQWHHAIVFTLAVAVVSHLLILRLLVHVQPAQRPEDSAELVARYREVQRALEAGEFRLYYQPEVSLSDNSLRAVEALVRWQQPNGTMVSPADFIPFVEDVGLIRPLGTWVLKEACSQLARWRGELPLARDLCVSVNVSAVQLNDPKFVSVVQSTLREAGLEPGALILEVTETGLVSDPKIFRVVLKQLQDLGVRIAVDDFGTGYAWINYLRAFKFDYVKLERGFITPLETSYGDRDLVAGLITLSQSLGAAVIAEGVSSAKIADVCRDLGCDWVQGDHFAPASPPEHIAALLSAEPLPLAV